MFATSQAIWRTARQGKALAAVLRTNDERARAHLASIIENDKGIIAKIGQMLSADGNDILAPSQGDLPPEPLEKIHDILSAAWHQPWQQVCSHIEPAYKAASLGQVHQATLHDGRQVAIKVLYPDMLDGLLGQCRVLGWMPNFGPAKKWGIDLKGHRENIFNQLQHECNYSQEAQMQTDFIVDPRLHKAAVISEYSTANVLVQEWLPGHPLTEAQQWSVADRNRLALSLLDQFLAGLTQHGWVHLDPHAGNIATHPDTKQAILYDYGAARQLSLQERAAFHHLFTLVAEESTLRDDPQAWLEAFHQVGFDASKLHTIKEYLPTIGNALLQPFAHSGPFDLTTWQPGQVIQKTLGEQAWWFRSAGSPALLSILRAAQGMFGLIRQLDVTINWQQRLLSLPSPRIHSGPIRLSSEHQEARIEAACQKPTSARSMRVRVLRDGKETVALTMPIRAIGQLTSIIPTDQMQTIKDTLAARGQSLPALIDEALANDLQPADLFDVQMANKRIHIALIAAEMAP